MNEPQHNEKNMTRQFSVLSIEKTSPPDNGSGGEWYRYVIGHESTQINGMQSGSLHSVSQYVEQYVEKLNARPYWGYSSYSTRSQKK